MALTEFLGNQALHTLGWLMIHLLWQGTIIALLLAGIMKLLNRAPAVARHTAAVAALLILLLIPMATFLSSLTIHQPEQNLAPAFVKSERPLAAQPSVLVSQDSELVPVPVTSVIEVIDLKFGPGSWLLKLPMVLTLIWLTGIVVASTRLGISYYLIKRLIRCTTPVADGQWQVFQQELQRKFSLRDTIAIRGSSQVMAPMLVGFIKPVLLLPTSGLKWQSAIERKMILAHELAHAEHRDPWFNMIALLAETLIWFHPATYYLTRKFRCSAEERCDEFVIVAMNDPLTYARALSAMDLERPKGLVLILAGTGYSLSNRIRRILAPRPAAGTRSLWGRIGVISCFMLLLIGCVRVAEIPVIRLSEPGTPQECQLAIREALDRGDDARVVELAPGMHSPMSIFKTGEFHADAYMAYEREYWVLNIEISNAARRRYDEHFEPPDNVEDLLPIPWKHAGRGYWFSTGPSISRVLADCSRLSLRMPLNSNPGELTDTELLATPSSIRQVKREGETNLEIDFDRDGKPEFTYDGRVFNYSKEIEVIVEVEPGQQQGQVLLADAGQDPRQEARLLFYRDGEFWFLLLDADGDGKGDNGFTSKNWFR